MWSSVLSRLSLSFRGNFLVVCPLEHDSILKKIFSQKSFSKNGMTLRNPKKSWEKRVVKEQVVQPNGTSWSTWNKWSKEKKVFRSTWNKWNKEKGVFKSSWNKWNKDKGSVQLNLHLLPSLCTRPCTFYFTKSKKALGASSFIPKLLLRLHVEIAPPKNGPIALWSATNRSYIVKCVSQKRNGSNNKKNGTIF